MGQLVLREQRAPAGSTDGGSPRGALLRLWPVLYVFLAVHAVARRRAGRRPTSGRTRSTCRTTRGRRWRTCGRSRSRSTSTSCWPSSSRSSPGAAGPSRLLVGVLVAVLVGLAGAAGCRCRDGVGEVRLQWRTHFRDGRARRRRAARRRCGCTAPGRVRPARAAGGGCGPRSSPPGVGFLADRRQERRARAATLGYTVAYLTGAAFLLLLHGAAWVPRARWLTRPMAALGRYSYGIYIWHVFAAELALDWLPGPGLRLVRARGQAGQVRRRRSPPACWRPPSSSSGRCCGCATGWCPRAPAPAAPRRRSPLRARARAVPERHGGAACSVQRAGALRAACRRRRRRRPRPAARSARPAA